MLPSRAVFVRRHVLAMLPLPKPAAFVGSRHKSGAARAAKHSRDMNAMRADHMQGIKCESPTGGVAINPYIPPQRFGNFFLLKAWQALFTHFMKSKMATWMSIAQLNKELIALTAKDKEPRPKFARKAFLEEAKSMFQFINQSVADGTIAAHPELVIDNQMKELRVLAEKPSSVVRQWTADDLKAKLISLSFQQHEAEISATFAQAVVEFTSTQKVVTSKDGKVLSTAGPAKMTDFWVLEWTLSSRYRWRLGSKLKRRDL
eukprot:TRINITY_DN24365_c0_g1_i1.p1 TRINITY_DN24365_c0_g1~~TRINITY_DN24365_c0_g1_i1.p1  ORF type:complete len:260 (-),score=70.21 TRINITY_DN24365_c0_g1_i1:338-1117(-)